MLVIKSYPEAHIDACRAVIAAQIDALEPASVDTLVLALDRCFVHRMRGQEGKGDSALKQVRTLADAITEGGPTQLGVAEFSALADAFFAEIEARFGPA